ncbi:hypothetical protein D030_1495, partial [Vibrio parahaemolyticus AQ3810]
TTAGWVERRREVSGQQLDVAVACKLRIGNRYRRKQCFCVGMLSIVEHLVVASHFHWFAKVHHHYSVADMTHNA